MTIDRVVLDARLMEAQLAIQRGQREHARLLAAITEHVAQMNILVGRTAELTDLLALPAETTDG